MKKSTEKKDKFSLIDIKMMVNSCSSFLNDLSNNPIFMVDNLRSFLGLRNINFKEVDEFIKRTSAEERDNHKAMEMSVIKINSQIFQTKEQAVQLKDQFVFKGIDRQKVLGNVKYSFFCGLGQSKWYFEKQVVEVTEFVKGLMFEQRVKKDQWLV